LNKEIDFSEAVFIIFGFIVGNSILIIPGIEAENLAWLVNVVATFIGMGLIYFYVKLSIMNNGQDIISICIKRLGPIIGKTIALGYVWYFFHLGALVIRDLTEFATLVSYPSTPQAFIGVLVMLLAISLVRNGIEVIAKFTQVVIPLVIAAIVVLSLLLINQMDVNNLKPFFSVEFKPFFKALFSTISFPYAEAVVLTVIFPFVKPGKIDIYLSVGTILFAGMILTLVTLTTILSLGNIAQTATFPAFEAARTISVFDFIERVEVISDVSFLIGTIVKLTVCLFGVSVGLSKILNLKGYQSLVIPIAILMGNLSLILYENISELIMWSAEIYPYYAVPFQFFIPGLLFILSLFGSKKSSSQS